MFIAMNRFRVKHGRESDFEAIWRERDTYLMEVPGYLDFHLLRGPVGDDHTLYASHTVWTSKSDFEQWTSSEAFRDAHRGAGESGDLFAEPPNLEGFQVIQGV